MYQKDLRMTAETYPHYNTHHYYCYSYIKFQYQSSVVTLRNSLFLLGGGADRLDPQSNERSCS